MEENEITYHAVEKDGVVTAIWEMQGRKHLRTIDPRSEEGRRMSFVHLLGVTAVAAESSLSEAALAAQSLRNELGWLATENPQVRHLAGSLVSHHPWQEIESLIEERMKDDDLLLLRWRDDNG